MSRPFWRVSKVLERSTERDRNPENTVNLSVLTFIITTLVDSLSAGWPVVVLRPSDPDNSHLTLRLIDFAAGLPPTAMGRTVSNCLGLCSRDSHRAKDTPRRSMALDRVSENPSISLTYSIIPECCSSISFWCMRGLCFSISDDLKPALFRSLRSCRHTPLSSLL